jgi:hypothetical protein
VVAGEGVNLKNSTLSNNDALSQGGALRTFGGDVRITDSTLSANTAVGTGGAIRLNGNSDATLIRSTLSNNDAGSGGGLASSGASVAIESSVVSGNTAESAGGLLLYGFYSNGSSSSVSDTLISGNTAYYAGLYSGSGGGAIVTGSSYTPVDFDNVTVTGNTASGVGGGIAAHGNARFTGATISGNTASRGGGVWSTSQSDTLRNSIVANNSATTAAERDLAVYDTTYASFQVAYTLVESTPTGGTITDVTPGSNIIGQDPQLGALAANGGPTQTLKPAAASPAVDQGKSFGLDHDQRGRNRPVDLATANASGGDGADMGAVELSSATDVPPAGTVTNSVAPTVPTAAPRVGVPVSVTNGTWSAVDSFSYQWYSGAAKIAGATSSSYTPLGEDAGNRLSVQVTGKKAGSTSTTVWSNQTGVVLAGDVHNTGLPSIGGTANPGSALVITSLGTWTPASTITHWQWLRNGVPISGATNNYYLISGGDLGAAISLRVTGLAQNYAPSTADSASVVVTAPVATPGTLVTSGTGSITGKLKVGKKVKAAPPSCTPAASVSYQWLRGHKAIANATKAKYKLKSADKGKKISVRVTYTLPGYNATVVTIKHAGKVK